MHFVDIFTLETHTAHSANTSYNMTKTLYLTHFMSSYFKIEMYLDKIFYEVRITFLNQVNIFPILLKSKIFLFKYNWLPIIFVPGSNVQLFSSLP